MSEESTDTSENRQPMTPERLAAIRSFIDRQKGRAKSARIRKQVEVHVSVADFEALVVAADAAVTAAEAKCRRAAEVKP